MRLGDVHGDDTSVTVVHEGDPEHDDELAASAYCTSYVTGGAPPSVDEFQVTEKFLGFPLAPLVAVTPVGTLGAVGAVHRVRGVDSALVPTAFRAVTDTK